VSDVIVVSPIFGVNISFEEFCEVDKQKSDLSGFMAGLDEKKKSFRGYYLGKELCEMGFPDEYSAEFDIQSIIKTREVVKAELLKIGIDKEPEFLLIEYMG